MTSSTSPEQRERARCQAIAQAAEDQLHRCLHSPVRQVSCEFHEGGLRLRGRLPSYYQKQLAQEAVVRLEGVHQVVNEIEVARPLPK